MCHNKAGKLCQWTVRFTEDRRKLIKVKLSRSFPCVLLISDSMVSREIWKKHALVSFSKTQNSTRPSDSDLHTSSL
jgi:hypothetical protein